ncbi:MAG TPA: nucleotidyl transferase AbiEii/AbiGii toxin family protein [Gammaproteobacteria bacterium]|nr:nucleotidyl transferase AbiEii/AbiGii toxin family protein [Gammaproteobacteria bacterium]
MNDLREQFLERLTRALFQKKGEGFVLKGGGAMRALFGSERLTKDIDLDFTNPKRSADSLHHSVGRAIESAARGLALKDLVVSEPGKAEASPKWKINFLDAAGQRLHVEVEVSRDPRRAPPGAVVQKPYVPRAAVGIPRFWVDIYDEPTLIATKVAALLGREAARDVYDLDLLMGASAAPSPELVKWAVQRAHLEAQDPVVVLHANLNALTWGRYLTELRDTLPEASAARIAEREWQAMKKRVGDYVTGLLQPP